MHLFHFLNLFINILTILTNYLIAKFIIFRIPKHIKLSSNCLYLLIIYLIHNTK